MKHGDYLVDLVDDHGHILDQKPRSEIDKFVDLYNGVHVLIITPQGQLVLSNIAERDDLPNIYARKMCISITVIRRSDETPTEAARRVLKSGLLLKNVDIQLLGESMIKLEDGRQTYLSVYYVVAEPPTAYSTVDIESLKLVSVDQFEEELHSNPERFGAALRAVWQLYRRKLTQVINS